MVTPAQAHTVALGCMKTSACPIQAIVDACMLTRYKKTKKGVVFAQRMNGWSSSYVLDTVHPHVHTQENTQKTLLRPVPRTRATIRFLVHRGCESRCACIHVLQKLFQA